MNYPRLLEVALGVAALNIPFGFWRRRSRKFSRSWFLAVHLPVPFAVALRLLSRLGWGLAVFGVLIPAYFLGQFLGGLLSRCQRPVKRQSSPGAAPVGPPGQRADRR